MRGGDPVIIVKKQARGHHGHHGGAWKVAYADFVTAMMAFFLVMWIVGQSPQIKAGVGGYFRDPGVFDRGRGDAPVTVVTGSGTGSAVVEPPQDVETAKKTLEQAAARLREALQQLPVFSALQDRIEIQVTSEGLRIELVDTSDQSFFEVGRSELRPETLQILGVIAVQLGDLPNKVAIEGHSDSRAFAGSSTYGNWELSTERANAARRVMERSGLQPAQLEAVRGFADTKLHYRDDPLDPRNRRVSIVVRNGTE